jgi:hypothetical protein
MQIDIVLTDSARQSAAITLTYEYLEAQSWSALSSGALPTAGGSCSKWILARELICYDQQKPLITLTGFWWPPRARATGQGTLNKTGPGFLVAGPIRWDI